MLEIIIHGGDVVIPFPYHSRAHMAYDHGGIKALKPKPSGGRQRENMTLPEERTLLRHFAKAAGAGEVLNIHDLKAAYEPRLPAILSPPNCCACPAHDERQASLPAS
jgi:hypothetical protein